MARTLSSYRFQSPGMQGTRVRRKLLSPIVLSLYDRSYFRTLTSSTLKHVHIAVGPRCFQDRAERLAETCGSQHQRHLVAAITCEPRTLQTHKHDDATMVITRSVEPLTLPPLSVEYYLILSFSFSNSEKSVEVSSHSTLVSVRQQAHRRPYLSQLSITDEAVNAIRQAEWVGQARCNSIKV